jgi:ribA/ribD-fused uncharacterized protein
VEYNTAEQFMMAQKALLFGDTKTHTKIMKEKSPREQKALGRGVEGFSIPIWQEHAKNIVYAANYAKFSQNPELAAALKATVGTTLVEASPYDNIWGIGLTEDDHNAQSRSTWKGLNWLGEVLTKVREDLIREGKI